MIDGTVHGAYDPQNLAAPQPITHIYIPPPGWTPPNFQPDPDRLAAREERRRTQRDAGRAATPAEVTDDVEDIYERVASGTNYTESQAADIRLAIWEAQEAAAEASAAADRAALLSNTAQGLARGARADLRRTGELSGDGDLGIGDALQDGDEPTHVDDPQPADTFDALIGPEIPDTAGGEIANAVDGPTDGDSPSPVPRRSGRRLTLEELQEVVAAGGDLRSPADIADRALYKAEKANDIADEAMQASQEAVLAASRMTRAFARLRQLTRDAKRQADGLPDDVAQTYADMAEAEIDGTMPIVERTNRSPWSPGTWRCWLPRKPTKCWPTCARCVHPYTMTWATPTRPRRPSRRPAPGPRNATPGRLSQPRSWGAGSRTCGHGWKPGRLSPAHPIGIRPTKTTPAWSCNPNSRPGGCTSPRANPRCWAKTPPAARSGATG